MAQEQKPLSNICFFEHIFFLRQLIGAPEDFLLIYFILKKSLELYTCKFEDNGDYCRGVFEQLADYTMRYQESDLHVGLYSSLTSVDNLNLPTLFYFSLL